MADRDDKDLSGAAKMNRGGLLKCMGWAGTGVVWTLSGGVPRTPPDPEHLSEILRAQDSRLPVRYVLFRDGGRRAYR